MKTQIKKEIAVIFSIISLTSFVGIQAKQHEQVHLISPLATRAYALEIEPPTKQVELASQSEQDKNVGIIKKIWGKDWQLGVAIAKCESGLDSQSINRSNSDGTIDVGLFQINSVHGWTEDEMRDPIANAGYAYSKYIEQGTDPWLSSKHCWSK